MQQSKGSFTYTQTQIQLAASWQEGVETYPHLPGSPNPLGGVHAHCVTPDAIQSARETFPALDSELHLCRFRWIEFRFVWIAHAEIHACE